MTTEVRGFNPSSAMDLLQFCGRGFLLSEPQFLSLGLSHHLAGVSE